MSCILTKVGQQTHLKTMIDWFLDYSNVVINPKLRTVGWENTKPNNFPLSLVFYKFAQRCSLNLSVLFV